MWTWVGRLRGFSLAPRQPEPGSFKPPGEDAHLRLQGPALGNQRGSLPLIPLPSGPRFLGPQVGLATRSVGGLLDDTYSRHIFRLSIPSRFLQELHFPPTCSPPVLLSFHIRSPGRSRETPDTDPVGLGGARESAFLTSIWLWPWPPDLAGQPPYPECF